MGVMESQLNGPSVVYSNVSSGGYKKKKKLRVTGLCEGNSPVTGEFPAQRPWNAENVSTRWLHNILSKIGLDYWSMYVFTGELNKYMSPIMVESPLIPCACVFLLMICYFVVEQ